MNGVNDPPLFIKDIKPGLKNLNVVFIVLEIGKWGQQPASPPCVRPGTGGKGAAAASRGLPSPFPPFPLPSPIHVAPLARAGAVAYLRREPGARPLPTFQVHFDPGGGVSFLEVLII